MTNVDMDSRLSDKHAATPPVPVPVYVAFTMGKSDEISLVDFWRMIVKRKAIVLVSFLLAVLVAFAYLVFSDPMYKADAYLLPPQQQKIQGLLIDYRGIDGKEGIGVERYTSEKIFSGYLDNLKSQGVRREFFNSHKLLKYYAAGKSAKDVNADRIFEETFNDRLKVQVDKKNALFVTVSFSDNDPVLAAQWLNQIIDFANKRTVNQLSIDVNSAIQSEIGKIRYQLSSKLKYSEQRRRDRIINLKEALSIASTLGIKDTGTFPRMINGTHAGLAVNTAEVPLYMRGADALETEIAVLESRKSDEPFIDDFRDLQERRTLLEGIVIDTDALSAVKVDTAARIPYRAEKPNGKLVFILAAALGLIAGIFLVFIAELRSKARE